eukprot:2194517-Amphidinium_carterae.1
MNSEVKVMICHPTVEEGSPIHCQGLAGMKETAQADLVGAGDCEQRGIPRHTHFTVPTEMITLQF